MIEKQNTIRFKNRSIIKVIGEEATDFLQSLITTDVTKIGLQEIFPGALLSPQGKVIADFLIGKIEDGYLIDIVASFADILQKRLLFYKLRRKVEITEPLQEVVTVFLNPERISSEYDSSFIDKRFPQKKNNANLWKYPPFRFRRSP